jgi:hypothetical protein
MDALNELWTEDLDHAIENAKTLGRYELADYFSLKDSNDRIRRESVKWLFDSVLEIVFAFNKHGAKIKIDQKEKHSFKHERSRLRGSSLTLKQGVRCLDFEAGWTQVPGDGIIRGGALAVTKISHFGFFKQNEDLVLLCFEDKPQWFVIDSETHRIAFNIRSLRKHFEVFLG